MSVHEALERLDSVGSACSSVIGKRVKVISKKIVSSHDSSVLVRQASVGEMVAVGGGSCDRK